ncbi:SH3 domain-containing protein [Pseudoroseicyclus sp. CXY001]|uniref:SH3 domain-containing protein n=1 Tax=Pseudoroseicyclus sp. CXY001 TaxID=3242492 RepID=UPI003571751F
MKSFIAVTFLFLGGAYYALSDGPNFVPQQQTYEVAEAGAEAGDVDVTRAAGAEVTLASFSEQGSLALPAIAAPATAEPAALEVVPEETITLTESGTEPATEAVEAAAEAPEADPLWMVDGSRVNMRAGPGTNYLVVDTLSEGTALEVMETRSGWARIRTVDGGVEGWMAERLIAPQA